VATGLAANVVLLAQAPRMRRSLPVESVAVSLARSGVRFCAVVIADIIIVIPDIVRPFHQTFFHNLLPSFRIRTLASALQSRYAHGTVYGEISGTGSS
jgi:hypothetical protein